ncbi:MFS transporter [Actinoplanes sp. NPDC023714]|uniref:MFS transporter n=1 Tax=Actinoplanes sp. NPDC023714 TaxID=3154322 RepID=UPI0033EC011A
MHDDDRWFGRFREVPVAVSAGVLVNAVFTGLVTVTLPLELAGQGASKGQIAAFFIIGALTAATLVLTVGPVVRRIGVPRWSLTLCAVVSAGGLVVVAAGGPAWRLHPAAALVMTMSLTYPLYVAVASNLAGASAARIVAVLRTIFVAGYLGGLGVFSLAAAAEQAFGPVAAPIRWAIGLALGAALVAQLPRPAAAGGAAAADGSAAAGAARTTKLVVLAAALAVLLMRAADSLRQVYLPLYALGEDIPQPLISTLFAVTVAVEVLVLAPLSSISDRFGSRWTLLGVCVTGVLSFATVALGGGYPMLVFSQALYAVFAAGFQSIGMVLLGDSLRSGLSGGAGAYTAVIQVGATVGIVAPLVVPGYSVAVFWIAVLFCLGAAALLLADPLLRGRRRRPAHDHAH